MKQKDFDKDIWMFPGDDLWQITSDQSERNGKSHASVKLTDNGLVFKGALIPIQGELSLVGFAIAKTKIFEPEKWQQKLTINVSTHCSLTLTLRFEDSANRVLQNDVPLKTGHQQTSFSIDEFKAVRRGKIIGERSVFADFEPAYFGLSVVYSRQQNSGQPFPFNLLVHTINKL